jgi:flagellar basal-body rod modification protein FlgD
MEVSTAYQTPFKTAASIDKQKNDKNYDTFLKMMTTQIKNQDPLNPMSADQLAVQLATFSGVEQQTKTNDLLAQLLGQSALAGMGQMVGWVGKEARLAAPTYFDGSTPVTLSPNPAQAATKAVLVVTDQNDAEVSRTELPLGTSDYAWQGRDAQGNILPKGIYKLSLESWQGDKVLDTSQIEHYAKISEIRSTSEGVSALLPGGVEALIADITAIRETPAS